MYDDVILFFVQDTIDFKSSLYIYFHIQLFILLGKYHIYVKKWAKSKPNYRNFIKEIKLYGTTYLILKTTKTLSL